MAPEPPNARQASNARPGTQLRARKTAGAIREIPSKPKRIGEFPLLIAFEIELRPKPSTRERAGHP
ncbi:protein of unknown function [Hyphomicrobium sp. MC1]|nr:protein of unknown function [Hyphomicrobium sp. MC1]